MVEHDVRDAASDNKGSDQQQGNGSVTTGLKIIGTSQRESQEVHDMKQRLGRELLFYLLGKNRLDVNGYLCSYREAGKYVCISSRAHLFFL